MAKRVAASRGAGGDDATSARRFWAISGGAGTLKSGQWILDPADDAARAIDTHFHFNKHLPVSAWPSEPPAFSYKRVGPLAPDVQWTFGDAFMVVSGRLRACLEANAPDHATFLPVRAVGPERERLHPEYWAVEWRHVLHGLWGPAGRGLSASRVPAGVRVARAPFNEMLIGEHVLVDGALGRALRAERFVGLRINPVAIDRGPDDLVAAAHPQTGARTRLERKLIPSDPYFDSAAFVAAFPPDGDGGGLAIDPLQRYVYWHSAFSTLREEHVRTLLDAGFRPRAECAQNETPWQVALNPRSPAMIALLSEYGTNWNVANILGITPLMAAASELNVEAIEAMMERGAIATCRDLAGRTALDHLLEAAEHDEIEEGEFRRAKNMLS